METVVSIDIGGTHTKLALVSAHGEILKKEQLFTQASQSVEGFFQALFDAIREMTTDPVSTSFSGIGIGAPGCNEWEGTIAGTANLLFKEPVPIRDIFEKEFGLPTYLIKDSNAAALGEHIFGGARQMQHFILLTLGTGLGCGLFLNGKLVRGSSGLASELGHVTVESGGRHCGCGKRGCLETYVSATGIRRTAFELLSEYNDESELRHYSFAEMTAQHISEAALRKDPLALKAFERTGNVLGRKIADLMACFEPEAVFLSGGLVQSGELLLRPTVDYLERHLLYLMKGKARVLPSALGTNDGALLGAASLVLNHQKEKIS